MLMNCIKKFIEWKLKMETYKTVIRCSSYRHVGMLTSPAMSYRFLLGPTNTADLAESSVRLVKLIVSDEFSRPAANHRSGSPWLDLTVRAIYLSCFVKFSSSSDIVFIIVFVYVNLHGSLTG